MRKRILFLALLLVLLCLTAAHADVLQLPENLRAIEAEAFMDDAWISDVKFPDGLETIGERAFLNTNVFDAVLPSSVTRIGENAFNEYTHFYVTRDSYAVIAYAQAHELPLHYLEDYAITEAVSDGDTVRITMNTGGNCFVYFSMYDKTGENFLYGDGWYFDDILTGEIVDIDLSFVPEEAAVLRVEMSTISSHFPICDPLEMQFTSRREQFENKTPQDYPKGTVLSFGQAGFGVLKETVRTVTGTKADGSFIVQSSEEIHPGDALFISDTNELIKAAAVTANGDGSYRITSSEEGELADFYEYLRYNATIDALAATQPRSRGFGAEGAFNITEDLVRFDSELSLGAFSAETSTGISVTCDFAYDASLFGRDYFDCKLYVTTDISASMSLSAGYSFERDFPLFLFSIPTSVPGMLIDLDLTLPVKIEAHAEARLSAEIASRLGFSFNSNSGTNPVSEDSESWDFSIDGSLSGSFGPRASVGLSLMRVIGANVGAQAGIEFEAATSIYEAHSNEPRPAVIHACDLCFDLDVSKFICLDFQLHALGTTLTEGSWPLYGEPIFDGYLSMINDDDSIFGGKKALGEGTCPNLAYRVRLQVEDPDDPQAVKSATVYRLSDGEERVQKAAGNSPLETYLGPGAYQAESDYQGQAETMNFFVRDSSVDLLMDFILIPIDEFHFPDAFFRAYVAAVFDADRDGMLSSYERSEAKVIDLTGFSTPQAASCASLEGIKYFTKLSLLTLSPDVRISRLDLAEIQLSNTCRSLNCEGMTALTELLLPYDTGLVTLMLSHTGIQTLDVRDKVWMFEIDVSYTPIRQLLTRQMNMLYRLDASQCKNLTALDLTGSGNLHYLSLDYSGISSLNLNGCEMMSELGLRCTPMTSVNLSSCIWLGELDIYGTDVTYVSLPFNCLCNTNWGPDDPPPEGHGIAIHAMLGTVIHLKNHTHRAVGYYSYYDDYLERYIVTDLVITDSFDSQGSD